MSLIRRSLSFMAGTVFGVYLSQNYNIPSIKTLASTAIEIAKHYEELYRKPKKTDQDD